jgi:hypothetical protein
MHAIPRAAYGGATLQQTRAALAGKQVRRCHGWACKNTPTNKSERKMSVEQGECWRLGNMQRRGSEMLPWLGVTAPFLQNKA